MSTKTLNGSMRAYQVPLIAHLPATDFIGRLVRVEVDNNPGYYKLISVDSEKYVTVEIPEHGRRRPVRIAVADVGPNWTRNPDLQAKSQKVRKESEKPSFNALVSAFDSAKPRNESEKSRLGALAEASSSVRPRAAQVTPPPAASPQPVVSQPPIVAPPEPTPAPVPEPEPIPEPTPAAGFRKLLSFQAPLDTDFSWTGDMKALRKALADHEELVQLVQEAERTVASATRVVEDAGVVLVWEGSEPVKGPTEEPKARPKVSGDAKQAAAGCVSATALPDDYFRTTTEEERKIAAAWVAGPGKHMREFTALEAITKCKIQPTRGISTVMASLLRNAGYQSRKKSKTAVAKLYHWKEK